MKTKEAIETLKTEIKLLGLEIEICDPLDDIDTQIIPANKRFIIEYKKIIALLQQGEKFKKMWGKLRTDNYYHYREMQYFLDEIEQQYFPKEKTDVNNNR